MRVIFLLMLAIGIIGTALAEEVVCVGDSITVGNGGVEHSYRAYLQVLDKGLVFLGGDRYGYGSAMYQTKHLAVAGETTGELRGRIGDDLKEYVPKTGKVLMLLHTGTNDVTKGLDLREGVLSVVEVIGKVLGYNPEIEIYVALIIPRKDELEGKTVEFNTMLGEAVRGIPHVVVVDMNGRFKANPEWAKDYLIDIVHPSDKGCEVMAQGWYEAIREN